ncbi:hypothetical protein DMC01_01155 [Campylobacter troglodytis]|nr:hypothetical protein DMC01_01155 [Campylobacter troglodytis]
MQKGCEVSVGLARKDLCFYFVLHTRAFARGAKTQDFVKHSANGFAKGQNHISVNCEFFCFAYLQL